MKTRISEFLDGELEASQSRAAIDALLEDEGAREAWRAYHLIGDVMRDGVPRASGLVARVAKRLAEEPTVLSPRPAAPVRFIERGAPWPIAASVAAVALVGWLAFSPGREGVTPAARAPEANVAARAPAPAKPEAVSAPRVAVSAQAGGKPTRVAPVRMPMTDSTRDYMLAHQGFSPRISLQGMVPYARTVSAPPAESVAR